MGLPEAAFKQGIRRIEAALCGPRKVYCPRCKGWVESPAQSLSEATLREYWRQLRGLTAEEWAALIDRAIKKCTYFPKPAELLAIHDALAEAHAPQGEDMLQKMRDWEREHQGRVRYADKAS